MLKKCPKCKKKKKKKFFCKEKNRKDGLRYWCRKCQKKYYRKYYIKHGKRIKRKSRKYYAEHKEERKKYHIEHREEKREWRREYIKKHEKDPEYLWKKGIRLVTRGLVLMGEIKKVPCAECGNKEVQVHHITYDDPFDMVWLCRKCHGKHRRL